MAKKISEKDNRIAELEEQNKQLKLELLNIAAWIFSYSESSVLARNPLFYDLWLRYGFKAAQSTGMFADWKDRRVMFDMVYEEIHKLRGDKEPK